jgi:hypothetical protein
MKKLNTTGSLWMDANANAYSYNTQLTGNYKGLSVFNNTFYSRTTRKHQAQFNKSNFDLILETCQYGTRLTDYEVEKAIKYELDYIDDCLKELDKKRNTQKKKVTIQELNNRKGFLVNVLSK